MNNNYTISYLILRQFIGALGIGLPWLLVIGCCLTCAQNCFQPSISHYYYSNMHIVFVGVLCLLGGFLICYKGNSDFENNSNFENTIANIAGFFAILVAAIPTSSKGFLGNDAWIQVSNYKCWFVKMHYASAGLLFVCFAIFCFSIFQQSDSGVLTQASAIKKKKLRNLIYKICGWVIVISIICIAVIAAIEHYKCKSECSLIPFSTFIFETIAVSAFGFSWLLKGSLEWPHSKSAIKRRVIKYLR